MSGLTRRAVLRGTAAAALGGLPREGAAQTSTPARFNDIDHIIIMMKENRSFDHYFGTLRGVRGFEDARAINLAGGRSVFHQPDATRPEGYALPFHLDTQTTSAQRLFDLDHSWQGQHASWNNGRMDGWLAAHRAADGPGGMLTMGYYTRADIPFYHALADAFTVCDGYHCSMLGPTHPNRYFLWTGTIDPESRHGGPALDNSGRHYGWETYPERLEAAGITWRIYHDLDDYGCNATRYFTQFQRAPKNSALFDHALRNRPFYELLGDLRRGNIPQVTWIVPPSFLSEHPDWLPAAGADHTSQVLAALWSNPKLWARTLFILNYDENDGQFDHVVPPTPEPGTPGEFINGLPIGLGFRVPCLLISPFTRGGTVCGDTFDHTSTLRLIEARFGVEVPNLSAWRRRTCGDLRSALGLGEVPQLDIPSMPDTAIALRQAEDSALNLPPPLPPTTQSMPRQEPGTRLRRGAA